MKYDHTIVPSNDTEDWVVDFSNRVRPGKGASCGGNCLGYTDRSQHVVLFDASLVPGEGFRKIAGHELGHVLEMQHTCVMPGLESEGFPPGAPPCTAEIEDVMNPMRPGGHATPADRRECHRAGSCP